MGNISKFYSRTYSGLSVPISTQHNSGKGMLIQAHSAVSEIKYHPEFYSQISYFKPT